MKQLVIYTQCIYVWGATASLPAPGYIRYTANTPFFQRLFSRATLELYREREHSSVSGHCHERTIELRER